MRNPPIRRLLAFARELQRVSSFEELLVATRIEVTEALGYTHAWLFVADTENPEEVRLLDASGKERGAIWEIAPIIKIRGDAMMEEILSSDEPVVVADARTDPRTNKQIVEQLGNRTIINVPLRLLDKPFGAFGTGTFGDEGCRAPTRDQLDYLIGMAGQLSVAAGRIRFLEERRFSELALRRTEEQLRQSQKMDAIGRLAGSVAHDFNNLLSVILSYSSLVLSELEPQNPLRSEIEAIRKAGERAADLTKQLLTFSRQQVLELKTLNLNDSIAEAERLLSRLLGENIELAVRCDQSLCSVRADPGQIDQVIMNLAINARDAMPEGGKLTIETSNVILEQDYAAEHFGVRPGAYALLAVSDTGVGMDKEIQSRIFEPFFTTKDKSKGTGLGLSTVFGIIKQSGGNVLVYSEPGQGTTFRIYLPKTEAANETWEGVTPPFTLRGTETILLTEDQDDVRGAASEILKRYGYQVLEARNAEEALLACERHPLPIHLLLTDVVMPQMSGPELAQRFELLRPAAKVLFMSGYTDNAILSQGILHAGVAYVQKPFFPELLVRRIREVLDSKRRSSPPASA